MTAEPDPVAQALRLVAAASTGDTELYRGELYQVVREVSEPDNWDVFRDRVVRVVDALSWSAGVLVGALGDCGVDRGETLQNIEKSLKRPSGGE